MQLDTIYDGQEGAVIIDDYTRAPIRKAIKAGAGRIPSMAELAKHYAAKLTNVKPAPRDTRIGAIAPRRTGGKYG